MHCFVYITGFENARGYQIERDNYIVDLLGKVPPPPDLSRTTHLKPITDRTHLPSPSNRRTNEKHEYDYRYDY